MRLAGCERRAWWIAPTLAALVVMAAALVLTAQAQASVAGCSRKLPVVAHRAGGLVVALPTGDVLPKACASETGYATSESSLAVSKDGTLVYSPAESENSTARSSDGGFLWSLTKPASEQPTAFWNTVDPWVIADRRTGRIFWSHTPMKQSALSAKNS